MALLRVDAGPLVPRLRSELAALLTSLTDGDWAQPTSCPGWSVHDVAAHLLGVELGNVSVRRDRWRLGPRKENLDTWLNRFNQQWVDAARRISPALLIELIKRYARDPSAPPLTWQGDRELADALAGVKAVLG